MSNPIKIDIQTGEIKVDINYFENKYLYSNLYQRHFFNYLLTNKYKIKTNININKKNGQLLESNILIYVPETKELMEIKIKEIKGKLRLNPEMKKATDITRGFIKKNKRVLAIAFTIVYDLLIDIIEKEVLPRKKEVYSKIAEEVNTLKKKYYS